MNLSTKYKVGDMSIICYSFDRHSKSFPSFSLSLSLSLSLSHLDAIAQSGMSYPLFDPMPATYSAVKFINEINSSVIFLSYEGRAFSQKMSNACALSTGKVPLGCLSLD